MPAVCKRKWMSLEKEMRSIVREFQRFQEVRLKFYGLTLDNVRSEIFVKFIIYLGILILAVKTATITKKKCPNICG